MSCLQDEFELEKSVRRFRETFHGKIAVEKATLLMRRYANNHQMVTWAVILKKGNGKEMVYSKCKPQSYHHRKPYGGVSKTPGPVLKSLYHGDAPLNFACQTCDKDWWRRVPQRKRVSHCHLCKKKYDPVPYDKMWGIGEFCCTKCTRSFR
uniref:Shiftless antiviral inhibitor of ribosomal frameshifting n=1 Tax=Salmo trutta TaxID=8032 RepID=A0A674A1W1_SALTR